MPSALIVTFAQSTVLNAISNLLAQLIDQRKNTVSRENPRKTKTKHQNNPIITEQIWITLYGQFTNNILQTPFTLNTLALLQFITYGILIVPINFYWQRALEARYPGFPSRAETSHLLRSWRSLFSLRALRAFFSAALTLPSTASPQVSHDAALPRHLEKEREKELETGPRWAPRTQRSGVHSFAMKFLLDQTVAGAMNIVLFVVLINFLKGETVGKVWELVLVVCFPRFC